MTHDPRTKDEIYRSLRDSLTGKIAKLSNFTERSFNYVWTRAFSNEVRELEIETTASEFAGWIDFVGGDITDDQLDNLGYDSLTADEINDVMQDEHLDEYVKIVGITRFEGEKATGEVTIDTQNPKTTIPEGTILSTAPDSDGTSLEFETTEKAETAVGTTRVSGVSIQAADIGTEYNVPADTIVRFNNPPIGVRGVTNTASTTGGQERETNQELRERAKQQVPGASDGGTVAGIKSYIRKNVDAVGEGDVILEEFTNPCPPFVDVIVDGGSDSDLKDAIDASRPAGVKHNLVRPQILQIGVNVDLLGTDIDKNEIQNDIEDFLLDSGIDENFYLDIFIKFIMNREDDIENIDLLDPTYDRITNERFTFSQDVGSAIAEDGGVFTDETSRANDDISDDMNLLPASPQVGDAYYFGRENLFSGFDLNITTAGSGTWDVVWEYYDGSSWTNLNNVTDNTNDFQTANVSSVSWDMPSDWVRSTIDGTEKYFVRGRLDSFSSISQQPLGEAADITGLTHRLDFTYEKSNGSITIEDDDGTTYTEGTDFNVTDQTGDGWEETIEWVVGKSSPDDGVKFSVDYDVTTASTSYSDRYRTDLVRHETFVFDTSRDDTFTYGSSDLLYELDFVPFSGTTSVSDNSGNTYTEGTDYEVIDDSGNGYSQTIEWQNTNLDGAIQDDGGSTTDFTSEANSDAADDIDLLPSTPATGDAFYFGKNETFEDTVIDISTAGSGTWSLTWEYWNGSSWNSLSSVSDGTNDFTNSGKSTVSWDVPNDWEKTDVGGKTDLYWTRARVSSYSSISTQPLGERINPGPKDSEDFTVTYDKKIYHLNYELRNTPDNQIVDIGGTTYAEGTDYEIVDYDNEDELDSIEWSSNPSNLDGGEEFYITYFTEGDIDISKRQKVDPSTNRIDVSVL